MKLFKNQILLFILVCLSIIIFINISKDRASAYYDGQSENYIGRGVHVLKYDYEDYKNISSDDIFNDTFFSNTTKNILPGVPEETRVYTGQSIQDYYKNVESRYSTDINIQGTYGVHTGAIRTNFITSNTIDFSEQRHSFFQRFTYDVKMYEMYLPSYYSHKSLYTNNLSNSFIDSLNNLKLNKTQTNFENFFNNYGTHIITQAYYGGKLDVYYTAATNYVNLSTKQKNDIITEIDLKMRNAMSFDANNKQEINFSDYEELSDVSIRTNFVSLKNGGNTLALGTYSDLSNNFKDWAYSINMDNSAYIGVKDNTLVPIWEILPSNYSDLALEMKEAYINLAINIGANINLSVTSSLPNSYTYNINIRDDEKKITDDGRENNYIDTVNLTEITGIHFNSLMEEGFKTVNISITFDHKEKHDGYQYIFLYKERNTNSNYLLFMEKYNRGFGRQKSYETIQTSQYSFDISELITENSNRDSFLYIYWGASGFLNDDWYNKNVEMRITVK